MTPNGFFLYTLLGALKEAHGYIMPPEPQSFPCAIPQPRMSSYQSPWRNSIIQAPGRNTSGTSSHSRGRPASMVYPRTSPPAAIVPPGPLPPDRDLMEGLERTPLLQDIIPVPKPDKSQEDICVKDYTYIGSYNWMTGDTPTILVPG